MSNNSNDQTDLPSNFGVTCIDGCVEVIGVNLTDPQNLYNISDVLIELAEELIAHADMLEGGSANTTSDGEIHRYN